MEKTEKKVAVNVREIAIHVGDGRKVAPGEPIPADVTPAVRKSLEASGFFK